MNGTATPQAAPKRFTESEIKKQLRGYFDKRPSKKITLLELRNFFSKTTPETIMYHVTTLIEDGFIRRVSRGVYELDPNHKSLDQIRTDVNERAKTLGNTIVSNGAPYDSKTSPLTVIENPRFINYLGHLFGEAILSRMKAAGLFVPAELEFIEALLREKYPTTPELLHAIRTGNR